MENTTKNPYAKARVLKPVVEFVNTQTKNPFLPNHEIQIESIGNPYVPAAKYINTKMVYNETLGINVAVEDTDNPYIPNQMCK